MTGALMTAAACGLDATPAAVNWGDISGGLEGPSNADQLISQINTAITLRAAISSAIISGGGGGLVVFKNGASAGGVEIANGNTFDFSASSGDNVRFTSSVGGGPSGSISYIVTVTNQSAGGAVLDTFAVNHDW